MKRWIVLIGMILCVGIVWAQEQDIVRDGDPWYLFREHGVLWGQRSYGYDLNKGWAPWESILQFSDKDHDDVTVYGVAVTTQYLPLNDTREYRAASMAPVFTVYQHIGGGAPPTWQLLDSATVDGLVKRTRFEYQTVQEDYVVPCYEFYFDTPHHFHMPTDTFFYIGYIVTEEKVQRFDEYWRSELNSNADSFWIIYTSGFAELITEPFAWGILFSGPDSGVVQPALGTIGWGIVFPIVQLRCTPTRLFTVRRGNSTAEVSWRRKDYPEFYQVALASADSLPESGVMVSTTDSTWTFDGLQAGTEYSVWVRKACRYTTAGYDTLVYSEWSAPMTFPTLGIGEVEAGGVDFAVSPNPVHGVVEVTLPQPLETDGVLSLYDLGGREVRQTAVPAGSSRVTLDTEGCPAGAYLLKLVSPQGVATRRLLVASGQ